MAAAKKETLFDKIRVIWQEKSHCSLENIMQRIECNPETAQLYLMAIEQGASSWREYLNGCTQKRREQPKNKAIAYLIQQRLAQLKKSRYWLATQLNAPRSLVYEYAQGDFIPSDEQFEKLCTVLETPYKTIDDLMRGYDQRDE